MPVWDEEKTTLSDNGAGLASGRSYEHTLHAFEGVVVSHRFQGLQDVRDESTIVAPATGARIIAIGTLVMRGEPSQLFHTWKSLALRPSVSPAQITDEIPCCFLAWRRDRVAGCPWQEGEVWFHGCQHRSVDPCYTDVHLTLVCDDPGMSDGADEVARVTQLEARLRQQLLAFKELMGG